MDCASEKTNFTTISDLQKNRPDVNGFFNKGVIACCVIATATFFTIPNELNSSYNNGYNMSKNYSFENPINELYIGNKSNVDFIKISNVCEQNEKKVELYDANIIKYDNIIEYKRMIHEMVNTNLKNIFYSYCQPTIKDGSNVYSKLRTEYIPKNIDENQFIAISNVTNSELEVESVMNEQEYIDKYISKLEDDRREQEKRLSTNMQLMEQRITEERRLSEKRIEDRFNEVMTALEKTNESTKNAVKDIEAKVDANNKFMRNIQITTILGIGAMVLAVASIAWSVFTGIKSFYTPSPTETSLIELIFKI